MDLKLKGHSVIITGGTKGIGRAIAETLSDEGCNIGLCARNADDVAAAVDALSAKGVKVVGQALDVADGDAFKAWIAEAGAASVGSMPLSQTLRAAMPPVMKAGFLNLTTTSCQPFMALKPANLSSRNLAIQVLL